MNKPIEQLVNEFRESWGLYPDGERNPHFDNELEELLKCYYKKQKENLIKSIKEVEQDWEDAGAYNKANACSYLIGYLNAKDYPNNHYI